MTTLRGLLLPLIVAALIGLLLHFGVRPVIGSYPSRIMMDVGVAIILAVSLTIVNGYTGQFSMGHAGFMTLGGYVAGTVTYYASMLIWDDYAKQGGFLGVGEWMLVGACLVAGVLTAGAGWLVGLPSLRLRGDYLAIVTLGFGEIMRVLLQQTNPQLFTPESIDAATWRQLIPPPVGGAQGFADIPKYASVFWIFVFAVVMIVFAYRLKYSSIGRAMLAIREDEIAAQAMGVDVTRLKVRAFVAAAFFAGVAGGLYAHQSGAILRPVDAGFQRSFDIIIMVVMGGMGSISGAILAAIILTILPQALLELAQYRMVLYALLLVVLMIFRQQGLFGLYELWDFLPRRKTRRPAITVGGSAP